MEKNRDARRGTMTASPHGGLSKRRPRSSSGSLRESHEAGDMLEIGRLRDSGLKKVQDRDKSTKNKRRKGDRLMNGSNRDDHDTSDDSFEDDDDLKEDAGLPPFRVPSPQPAESPAPSSSVAPGNHLRCSFPAKVVRAPAVWNVVDKMIGVPVPRKARSAYGKRSQDWVSCGGGAVSNRQSSASAVSPSSSSPSVKKKIKPISGIKHSRTPKIVKSSSIKEIEIEVAEVLFGMTQQIQPKQDSSQMLDSKDTSELTSDARVSSQPLLPAPTTSNSAQRTMMAAAPKRKKPRHVKHVEEPCPVAHPVIHSASSADLDASVKAEAAQNGGATVINHSYSGCDVKNVPKLISESEEYKDLKGELDFKSEKCNGASAKEEASCVPLSAQTDTSPEKKADPAPDDPSEKKMCIDLMAPSPGKSSSEQEGFPDFPADHNRVGNEDISFEKFTISCKEDERKLEPGESTENVVVEYDSTKQMCTETAELELLSIRNQNDAAVGGRSKQQLVHEQQSKAGMAEMKQEKPEANVSMALPLPLAAWPESLPYFGYMGQVPPLQSVFQIGGSLGLSSRKQTLSALSPNPRLKRCATHCYIAKNIFYFQMMAKMNQFWPVAAGPLPQIYGAKPYNLNTIPLSAESPAISNTLEEGSSIRGRNFNSLQQEKAGTPLAASGEPVRVEASQTKQFVLQQHPHPGAHGPALVFSLNQQASASTASSVRSGLSKPEDGGGNGSATANSVITGSVTSGQVPVMNYNYLPQNEAQARYLAILQNTAYPLSISAPSGGGMAYKGAPVAQTMPYFNGAALYPSQILPSAQSQAPQLPPEANQTIRSQSGQQNLRSTSSGSSSSQKHHPQQSKQLVAGGGVAVPADASVHAVSSSSQALLSSKQRPQLLPHQNQLQEQETIQKNVYGQRFTLPILPQNFALVSSTSLVIGGGAGNQGEKSGPTQQQQSVKMELSSPRTFSMSFSPLNNTTLEVASGGAPPGIDFASMAQNHHAFLQSLPDEARHAYQINVQHLKKPHIQSVEDPRSSHNSMGAASASGGIVGEQERKLMSVSKAGAATERNAVQHQSFNFSRTDSSSQMSSLLASCIVDNAASRTINLLAPNGNGKSRASNSSTSLSSAGTATNCITSMPNSFQQQQQMVHLTKQQQQQMLQIQLASRTKLSASISAASAYSERLPSVSTVAKFPPSLAGFPSHQQGSSTSYPQQWNKSPLGVGASSSSLPNESNSFPKVNSSQHVTLSPQTHISFGLSNSLKAFMGHHHAGGSADPSLPSAATGASIVVSSPPTSASKGSTGGSPRASNGSKSGTSSSAATASLPALSSSGRKSSPVSSRNAPSFLGHPHVSPPVTSSGSSKQQQKQQTVLPQPQPFFNNAYLQSQAPHLNVAYHRRQLEQPQQPFAGLVSDPAKVASSATSSSMPQIQAVPSVSTKGIEQKPAAGTRSTLPP